MAQPQNPISQPTDTGSAERASAPAVTFAEPTGPVDASAPSEPAPEQAEQAAEQSPEPEQAAGYDQDGDPVDTDVVALALRYETIRQNRAGVNAQSKTYGAELIKAERAFLNAMTDAGITNVSIVMPGSGENRVITPTSKTWPKVRQDPDAEPDPETGERPTFDEAARIAALREAGLGHLVVEKIDSKALNETFDAWTREEQIPEPLRRVYELTRQWGVSSAKGRQGRVRMPTRAEVAQGKAPRRAS